MSLRFALTLPLILGVAAPSLACDTEEANRQFVAAMKSWQEADAISHYDLPSLQRKDALLADVVSRLNSIVEEHSGSDLAVQLITGHEIGALSLDPAQTAFRSARTDLAREQCRTAPAQDCFFTLALEAAERLEGHEAEEALESIMISKAEAGRREEAERILNDLGRPEKRIKFLLAIAKAEHSPAILVEALEHVLSGRHAHGNPGFALTEDWYVGRIAVAYAEMGMPSEARETARKIKDEGEREYALVDVASALARTGKTEDGLDVVRSIGDFAYSSTALRHIAMAQAKAGMKDEALATAEGILHLVQRAYAMVAILDPVSEEAAFLEALRAAGDNDDKVLGPLARAAVVAIAEAGEIQKALEIAPEIPITRERNAAFGEIAAVQAVSGDVDAAMSIIANIGNQEEQAIAICGLAEALARAGHLIKSVETLELVRHSHECQAMIYGRIAAGLKT